MITTRSQGLQEGGVGDCRLTHVSNRPYRTFPRWELGGGKPLYPLAGKAPTTALVSHI